MTPTVFGAVSLFLSMARRVSTGMVDCCL